MPFENYEVLMIGDGLTLIETEDGVVSFETAEYLQEQIDDMNAEYEALYAA